MRKNRLNQYQQIRLAERFIVGVTALTGWRTEKHGCVLFSPAKKPVLHPLISPVQININQFTSHRIGEDNNGIFMPLAAIYKPIYKR